MSCPVLLDNTSGGALIFGEELDGLGVNVGDTGVVLTDMFDLEQLVNSTELQGFIDTNDAVITYNGITITDLDDLFVGPSELADAVLPNWEWSCGRRGRAAMDVDFVRYDKAGAISTPFVAKTDCEIRSIGVYSDAFPGNWSVIFVRSSDFGANWTFGDSIVVTAQSQVIELGSPNPNPIQSLTAGDYLRVRFNYVGQVVENPSVNLLVQGV